MKAKGDKKVTVIPFEQKKQGANKPIKIVKVSKVARKVLFGKKSKDGLSQDKNTT